MAEGRGMTFNAVRPQVFENFIRILFNDFKSASSCKPITVRDHL